MRSVISSALSQAWNYLAADRKQDNYPLCSPAVARDAAWAVIGVIGVIEWACWGWEAE